MDFKGQGESVIKLLVVAIIAIIAIALVKSYFQKTSATTQQSVESIISGDPEGVLDVGSFSPPLTSSPVPSFLSNTIV